MVKDLTRGKPFPLILKFCLPLLAGNIFQQFYNLVDTIVVGKFVGTTALTAVGSVGSLNFLVIGTVLGFCQGLAIPIAQAFGGEDYPRMKKLMAHITYICVVLGLIVTGLTVALNNSILRLMNTPDDIFEYARDYITIIFWGIPATILYNVLACIIRSVGDSKTPLYFLLLSSALNVALDLLFVLCFNMEVKGVAVATVLSQLISGLLCLLVVKRKFPLLLFSRGNMKPDIKEFRGLVFISIPMALQFSITGLGTILMQSAVNTLGSMYIAAITVSSKIANLLEMPGTTLGMTMATFSGQNLGAGRVDRIRQGVRCSCVMGIFYALTAFVIMSFFATNIALMFIDAGETEILEKIKEYCASCSYFFFPLGLIFVFRNTLQGMGYSTLAMGGGVFELGSRGIFAFLMVPKFGFKAACYSNPMAWISADVLLIPAYFYKIKKLEKKLMGSN